MFSSEPLISNFFSVATAPVLFKLPTLIFSFAINVLADTTSFAMKFLFVNISPSLFTFPFIEILSKLFTFPLFFKLFATSIFEFACIFPLLFKEPSTFKISPVETFPVFSKFLTFILSFAEILELFSTSPFKETLFPDIPVPANLILSAFIDISPSEYVKSF